MKGETTRGNCSGSRLHSTSSESVRLPPYETVPGVVVVVVVVEGGDDDGGAAGGGLVKL